LGGALPGRRLEHFPTPSRRVFYSALVVLATVILFYEFSVAGAVGPSIISRYHMTFNFYVYVAAIASVLGAVAALVGGLTDRWGRANLIAYGLVATGLLTLFGIPRSPDKWVFLVLYGLLGFLQGMILVASSALIRDFSPQVRRAAAMGFWSLGPVLGSLIVTEVSSHTLDHLGPWQDQFTICGIAGLIVAGVALVGLRELSPALRDQILVSSAQQAAVEARAAGGELPAPTTRPWRQMLHLDTVGSALGISVFLLVYYVAVGFFVVYLSTVFGFSQSQANGVTNWFWGAEGASLLVAGVVSDRLGVRKPFVLFGAAGSIVMTVVFLSRATHPHTSYGTLVVIVALLAVGLGMVTGPWLAAFTETVERRNPALTGTGLAVWGWVSRIVIAVSTFVLPLVVTSTTTLVDYGSRAQAISARYPTQLAVAQAVAPATLSTLAKNPTDGPALAAALADVERARHVPAATAVQLLVSLKQVPAADLQFMLRHGTEVRSALAASPRQWQRWYWVCVAGEVVFVPSIFLLAGRWRPRRRAGADGRRPVAGAAPDDAVVRRPAPVKVPGGSVVGV
jgi:MFS family permease